MSAIKVALVSNTLTPNFEMPKAGYHRNKAIKLYEKQSGLCWICGYPMLPVNFEKRSRGRSSARWEVTVDHIGVKDGSCRPKKAAHFACNSARHHDDVKDIGEFLKGVTTKFQNENWVKSIFGKEAFETLRNPVRIP